MPNLTGELQYVKCLGLIHHVLQRYGIGHKLVVDDGLFLVLVIRNIGPEMTASTERQVFGKVVMPFNLGHTFVDRAMQGFVHDPFQQVGCAYRVSEFLQG